MLIVCFYAFPIHSFLLWQQTGQRLVHSKAGRKFVLKVVNDQLTFQPQAAPMHRQLLWLNASVMSLWTST